MKNLECIIFNVDHGFAAFIKSPNNYGLMIDCGSRENFSPIKWIRKNYNAGNGNISYYKKRRIAELKITHLHRDHFDDIGSFEIHKEDSPKHLLADKKTEKIVDKKIKEGNAEDSGIKKLKEFKKFRKKYSEDVEDEVDFGFDFFEYGNITYEEADEVSANEDKLINNRSFIFGIGYGGKKILFPGDIEKEGWEKAIEKSKIQKVLKDTTFFVASHHGHKSGFYKEVLEHSGKPLIYLISSRAGDTHGASEYSSEENSHGDYVLINGEKKFRRSISTKAVGKSIKIVINENGTHSIELFSIDDNLNKNQKKIRDNKTQKYFNKYGY
jgi:hypothetical protein